MIQKMPAEKRKINFILMINEKIKIRALSIHFTHSLRIPAK